MVAPKFMSPEGLAKAFYDSDGPENVDKALATEVLDRGEEVLWNWPSICADAQDVLSL